MSACLILYRRAFLCSGAELDEEQEVYNFERQQIKRGCLRFNSRQPLVCFHYHRRCN